MDNDFYSCQGTFNFTQNNDEVSMELKFDDSDNAHCAVYQKGSDLLEVLTAFIEDIDGQLADSDDRQADLEEMTQLETQIKELNSKLDDIYARYEELQDRTTLVSTSTTPKMVSVDEILKAFNPVKYRKPESTNDDDTVNQLLFKNLNKYFDNNNWFSN